MQEVTIGRIVVVQPHPSSPLCTPRPAIVIQVHDQDVVDVMAFPPVHEHRPPYAIPDLRRASVVDMVQSGVIPDGTWSWPQDVATVPGAKHGKLGPPVEAA